MADLISLKNIKRHYDVGGEVVRALDGVDLVIKENEYISIMGPSGSGKSTLMNMIGCLDTPTDGNYEFGGELVHKMDDDQLASIRNRKIGFVFQDYPLFPHLNLEKNITFNLEKKYEKNLDYILKLTGLKFLLKRFPYELSGGEQQRACIARALIREPELLLLDEPFSNLDSTIKESMREEIYKIIKKTKTTTILVTHDINDALNISDRILIFKAGILQQYDNPVTMYCEPANCYCAEILGDMNKLFHKKETYYVRPERVRVSNKKSKYKVHVEKCYFQGKEYKVKGKQNNETWHFFSKNPLEENKNVYVDFGKKDLIYFDPVCKNFFK